MTVVTCRRCPTCKIEKPLAEFYANAAHASGIQTLCRVCQSEKNREQRRKKRRFVWDYLTEHPCVLCGEADPRVLDFDHVDRTNKADCVSGMLSRSRSLVAIQREIEKCRVLCANCHRRETCGQLGYYLEL